MWAWSFLRSPSDAVPSSEPISFTEAVILGFGFPFRWQLFFPVSIWFGFYHFILQGHQRESVQADFGTTDSFDLTTPSSADLSHDLRCSMGHSFGPSQSCWVVRWLAASQRG